MGGGGVEEEVEGEEGDAVEHQLFLPIKVHRTHQCNNK